MAEGKAGLPVRCVGCADAVFGQPVVQRLGGNDDFRVDAEAAKPSHGFAAEFSALLPALQAFGRCAGVGPQFGGEPVSFTNPGTGFLAGGEAVVPGQPRELLDVASGNTFDHRNQTTNPPCRLVECSRGRQPSEAFVDREFEPVELPATGGLRPAPAVGQVVAAAGVLVDGGPHGRPLVEPLQGRRVFGVGSARGGQIRVDAGEAFQQAVSDLVALGPGPGARRVGVQRGILLLVDFRRDAAPKGGLELFASVPELVRAVVGALRGAGPFCPLHDRRCVFHRLVDAGSLLGSSANGDRIVGFESLESFEHYVDGLVVGTGEQGPYTEAPGVEDDGHHDLALATTRWSADRGDVFMAEDRPYGFAL